MRTDKRSHESGREFILDGMDWGECDPNENPFENVRINKGTYPLFISFFRQAGLRLPLYAFLVTFLRDTRFHLGQLTPNIVRIVLGVAEPNRRFNLSLGFNEIKF